MAGEVELAFGIAALVYAAGLALFRLPLLQLRRWGWTLMMHSWSGVAVIAVVGSLAVVKSLLASYLPGLGLNLPLAATFDDAIASARASRDMALAWIGSVSYAALALGSVQALMMLAMLVVSLTGVGLIVASIASYLISTVFGLLGFVVKVLSGVVLFMEGVAAFVGMSKAIAPALFVIGAVAFMIPFARTMGKTLMVLGAALTLGLPVAVVAASPPPGYADASIAESAQVQALSIAGRAVADVEAGVRYTVYDRKNDSIWYPFLQAEALSMPEIDREKACANLPRNVSCEQIIEIIRDVIRTTPEKAIFDTGGSGYYNAYDEGYRLAIVNNTYARKVWFLNMWVTLHDTSPKNVAGRKIPEQPDPQVLECTQVSYMGSQATVCPNPYLLWKQRWEEFWRSAPLYNETSQWMVAANRKTTFVWFTEQPWGTPREDLNIYGITLPKVRETRWTEEETYECETDGNSTTVETCSRTKYYTRGDYSGNKSVYFVYLNMPDQQVCGTGPIGPGGAGNETLCHTVPGTPSWIYRFIPGSSQPSWSHTVMNSSFAEIHSAGFIDGYGPYELPQSVQTIDRNQPLVLNAPTNEGKVFVTADQTIVRSSYDGYPEVPDRLDYSFRVVFTASESAPYLPEVEWHKFDEDERYFRNLAAGAYVPNSILGVTMDTMRQEWGRYQNFRQGLYRDSAGHEIARRITHRLLEYREETWKTNQTIFDTSVPLAKTITDIVEKHMYGPYAGSNIQIPVMNLLLTPAGAVGVLKPLSELIGQSMAIGIAIALLAIIIDSFNALVGGQSVMMKYFFTKVGNISHGMKFFQTFLGAVHRMSKVDLLTRALAWRKKDQFLKTLLDARKADREGWKNVVKTHLVKKGVFDEQGRVREWLTPEQRLELRRFNTLEKKLDMLEQLEGQKGFTAWLQRRMLSISTRAERAELINRVIHDDHFSRVFAKAYADNLIAKGVDRGEAFAKAENLVRYFTQSTPVKASPMQVAEGWAAMIRNADSKLEKIAMVDSFARSDFTGTLVKAGVAGMVGSTARWLGPRVSQHFPAVGATLSHVGDSLDMNLRAPAAFALAAEAQKPVYTVEGVRPTVGFSTGPYPYKEIGVWTGGRPTADVPYVKDHVLGGDVEDVIKAGQLVDKYGAPSDKDRFDANVAHFLDAVKPYDESFRLSDFINPDREKNVVASVELVGKDVFTSEFEVPADRITEFKEMVESAGGRITSVEKPTVFPEDSQTYQPNVQTGGYWWNSPEWMNEQGGKTAGDSQADEGGKADSWWSGTGWKDGEYSDGFGKGWEDEKAGDYGWTAASNQSGQGEQHAGGWEGSDKGFENTGDWFSDRKDSSPDTPRKSRGGGNE